MKRKRILRAPARSPGTTNPPARSNGCRKRPRMSSIDSANVSSAVKKGNRATPLPIKSPFERGAYRTALGSFPPSDAGLQYAHLALVGGREKFTVGREANLGAVAVPLGQL